MLVTWPGCAITQTYLSFKIHQHETLYPQLDPGRD